MLPLTLLVLVAAVAVALAFTGVVVRYARTLGMVDLPNERSSHVHPTPRGGGLGIIASAVLVFLLHQSGGLPHAGLAGGMVAAWGGLAIAAVGFVDDRGHVPALVRLVIQFAGAILVVYGIGGMAGVDLPFPGWVPDGLSQILLLTAMVWFINVFNFMDGIDGIAGIEALTVLLGGAAISAVVTGGGIDALFWPLVLAAGVSGFLIWNWPPARVFMGDSGSGFLGLMLCWLALDAYQRFQLSLWVWPTLAGLFITDATWTLFRRVMRREPVHHAHRCHGYQHLASGLLERFEEVMEHHHARRKAHTRVTVGVALINLLWLLPCALGAALLPSWGMGFFVLGCFPLLLLAWRSGAGVHEPENRLWGGRPDA